MKFLFIFFFAAIIFILLLCRVKVKWKTFLKIGFLPRRGPFGLYCYCGSQGNGKTYSLIEYLEDNKAHIKVYSNVSNISINGLKIDYYKGFRAMLNIIDDFDNGIIKVSDKEQLVILYDELFSEFVKGQKVDPDFMEFLAQLRKRKIIILTTCQYWAELPISIRRFCRYQIDCKMFNLLFIGILWKRFRDAENMKWSNDDQDFIAPLVENTFSKCRLKVAKSYNTNERIKKSDNTLKIS